MDLNMKILIADDFPEVTRLIRNILKNIGFTNIREAEGGKAVLRALKKKIKKLEIKLRKNIELNEQSQVAKKQSQAKSDISDIIRRRKGEPDKRIPLNVNRRTD